MFLKSLSLKNFRNYSDAEVNFHPHFNFVFGKNAQGKTNLLEAVYYLVHLKSFRASHLNQLIGSSNAGGTMSQGARLSGRVEEGGVCHEIRIHLQDAKREVWLNQKKPVLLRDFYGLVKIILFEPWEVYLFRENPSARRRFLDRALFLDDPSILPLIREYEKIVGQKNRLLKEVSFEEEEFWVWNEKQAETGSRLLKRRFEWITKTNELLPAEYQRISQTVERMSLRYVSSFLEPEQNCLTEDEIRILFLKNLQQKSDEEKRRGESLIGPHRDDWISFLNDRPLGVLGSQGENRCGVIALKSAQIHLLQQEGGGPPIFLLDDVASELDAARSKALFSYLKETPGQVFVTTTEPAKISEIYPSREGASFFVEEGKIQAMAVSTSGSS